jgi:hypothetical protein
VRRFASVPVGFVVAVLMALALLLGAGGVTPQSAFAAQNIDSTSCGGVGHPNCTNLPANVTIGANSCTVASSCDNLVDGAVIGHDSCNGNADACDSDSGTVGNNSCNGLAACGSNAASVGDGSCNGSEACTGNPASVLDGSCNGDHACFQKTGAIASDACNGVQACYRITGNVGDGSCVGDQACYKDSNSISDGSCIGTYACDGNTGPIGNGSCNDYKACAVNTGDVNDNACNGPSVCENNSSTVGECEQNTGTVPLVCTQHAIIEVNKVLLPSADSSRFDLLIDGEVEASAVGDRGSTGAVGVFGGSHTVGEEAVSPASLSSYKSAAICLAVNPNAFLNLPRLVGLSLFSGSATFSVGDGDAVFCWIVNVAG